MTFGELLELNYDWKDGDKKILVFPGDGSKPDYMTIKIARALFCSSIVWWFSSDAVSFEVTL